MCGVWMVLTAGHARRGMHQCTSIHRRAMPLQWDGEVGQRRSRSRRQFVNTTASVFAIHRLFISSRIISFPTSIIHWRGSTGLRLHPVSPPDQTWHSTTSSPPFRTDLQQTVSSSKALDDPSWRALRSRSSQLDVRIWPSAPSFGCLVMPLIDQLSCNAP